MFGFLRKNDRLSSTAESTALLTTGVTAAVTPDVTAPPKLTAESTAAVTTVVTTDVTAATLPSSRIIAKWTDPKPFPPPEGPVQIWLVDDLPSLRAPSARQIAEELFAAIQRQPICAGRWVLALSIETLIYPFVCHQLGWPERPWMGKDGVAFHLARLSGRRPEYKRTELNGEKRNLLHYYIPHPQEASVADSQPPTTEGLTLGYPLRRMCRGPPKG